MCLPEGKGNDLLYGDAVEFYDFTGETGADRFMFAGASGKDIIGDFEQGQDQIDVIALGYTDFNQITIDLSGDDSIVHFKSANQVTAEDVTALTASDCIFAPRIACGFASGAGGNTRLCQTGRTRPTSIPSIGATWSFGSADAWLLARPWLVLRQRTDCPAA